MAFDMRRNKSPMGGPRLCFMGGQAAAASNTTTHTTMDWKGDAVMVHGGDGVGRGDDMKRRDWRRRGGE